MEINKTLKERGNRYGKFSENSRIAQDLKHVFRSCDGWWLMSHTQREALDMCASKISRILTGDPKYVDNWHDMQGYLKLVEESLKNEQGKR